MNSVQVDSLAPPAVGHRLAVGAIVAVHQPFAVAAAAGVSHSHPGTQARGRDEMRRERGGRADGARPETGQTWASPDDFAKKTKFCSVELTVAPCYSASMDEDAYGTLPLGVAWIPKALNPAPVGPGEPANQRSSSHGRP